MKAVNSEFDFYWGVAEHNERRILITVAFWSDRTLSRCDHPVLYLDTLRCVLEKYDLLKLFCELYHLFIVPCSIFLPFDLKLILSDELYDSTENGNW